MKYSEIIRVARQSDTKKVLVFTAWSVIKRIIDEEFVGKLIRFQAAILYLQDKYDVVMV